jgi:hypothetical protein
MMPVSAVLREIEAGRLKYAPIENANSRTLVLAQKQHSRSPRIMTAMDKIVQDVIFELHGDRRVFGELKVARPVPPPERKALLRAV